MRIRPFKPRRRCQLSSQLRATLRDRSRFALPWEVSPVKADHVSPCGIEAAPQPAAEASLTTRLTNPILAS